MGDNLPIGHVPHWGRLSPHHAFSLPIIVSSVICDAGTSQQCLKLTLRRLLLVMLLLSSNVCVHRIFQFGGNGKNAIPCLPIEVMVICHVTFLEKSRCGSFHLLYKLCHGNFGREGGKQMQVVARSIGNKTMAFQVFTRALHKAVEPVLLIFSDGWCRCLFMEHDMNKNVA